MASGSSGGAGVKIDDQPQQDAPKRMATITIPLHVYEYLTRAEAALTQAREALEKFIERSLYVVDEHYGYYQRIETAANEARAALASTQPLSEKRSTVSNQWKKNVEDQDQDKNDHHDDVDNLLDRGR